MKRELVLKELYGRLWHTTHPDRFKSILTTGAILPEPDIRDSERWKTSQGKDFYPYVRTLGGVSLFDFDQFEPENYTKKCPMCSWYEFVPYQTDWGRSVWIEIDRKQVAAQTISEGLRVTYMRMSYLRDVSYAAQLRPCSYVGL